MSLKERIDSAIARFARWGWKGVWEWIAKSFRMVRCRWFITSNARRNRMTVPVRGITIVGPLTQSWSMSKTMRDLIVRLKEVGVPYQTFDTGATCDRVNGGDYQGLLTPRNEFNARKYALVLELHYSTFPRGLGPCCGRVCFWEADVAFKELCPCVQTSDMFVTMSDFNHQAIVRVFAEEKFPVEKLLYPLLPIPSVFTSSDIVRAKYGMKPEDFVVFSNFDLGSYQRKNPLGMLRAFSKAFPTQCNVKLMFKVNHAATCQKEMAEIDALARELGIEDRLVIVSSYIPQHDIYGLTNACDVYFSLNRGEGFGLGIAEAMSLAKPVVITDYGAPKEFCDNTNAVMIPFVRVAIKPGEYFMKVGTWPEPDVDAAAAALRRLHDDADLRQKIGLRARSTIEEHFSNVNFKKSVDALLDAADRLLQ